MKTRVLSVSDVWTSLPPTLKNTCMSDIFQTKFRLVSNRTSRLKNSLKINTNSECSWMPPCQHGRAKFIPKSQYLLGKQSRITTRYCCLKFTITISGSFAFYFWNRYALRKWFYLMKTSLSGQKIHILTSVFFTRPVGREL